MSEAATPAGPDRTAVVAAAIDLFLDQGFEATSVEQIAHAAGVSRSTFFRQFGGKDDVVFADHELLLAQLRDYLAQPHENPWVAVCEASNRVFVHFAANPDVARRRYQVVRQVPVPRAREIITVFRCELRCSAGRWTMCCAGSACIPMLSRRPPTTSSWRCFPGRCRKRRWPVGC